MTAFANGFRDEILKIAFGPTTQRTLLRAQVDLARKLLGVDPRVPVPFAESRLDDAVSKLRLQQQLVEMNRMAMSDEDGEEKSAAAGWMTPRTARRALQNTGYDDRDPGFRVIAHQLTGEAELNRMTHHQLKMLVSILTGRAP